MDVPTISVDQSYSNKKTRLTENLSIGNKVKSNNNLHVAVDIGILIDILNAGDNEKKIMQLFYSVIPRKF